MFTRARIGWLSGAALVTGAVCIGMIYYLAPTREAERLGMAVSHQNIPYLATQMDYPALRVNLRANLYRIIAQNNAAHHLNLPPAAMVSAAENGSRQMATPAGVSALLRQTLPQLGQHIPIAGYTYRFLAPDRFLVALKGPSGGQVRVVLYRQGWLTWKVGDVEMLPPGMPVSAYPAPATERAIAKATALLADSKAQPPLAPRKPLAPQTPQRPQAPAKS
ncbi:DUF2939 domain-containing protein [Thiomonas sp.]